MHKGRQKNNYNNTINNMGISVMVEFCCVIYGCPSSREEFFSDI